MYKLDIHYCCIIVYSRKIPLSCVRTRRAHAHFFSFSLWIHSYLRGVFCRKRWWWLPASMLIWSDFLESV